MKGQVGQTPRPDLQVIVNPLQTAAVPTPIGIMDLVLVELPAATMVDLIRDPQVPQAQVVLRHPGDAEAVGLIMVHALANKPHHRDATMCQLQVAEADFIGILLPALAVRVVHHQVALRQLQLHQAQQAADHVRQDIIGCLTVADGACLTEQPAVAQPVRQLQHTHLLHQHPQQHQPRLRLLKHQQAQLLHLPQQLPQQPNQALLLHPQVNPYLLPPTLNAIYNFLMEED